MLLLGVLQFLPFLLLLIGITSSAIGLKICAIIARIKKCNSIIKKKEKKHNKIVILAKPILNDMEFLISKALTDSYITHDEFVLSNIVLKEYDEMNR